MCPSGGSKQFFYMYIIYSELRRFFYPDLFNDNLLWGGCRTFIALGGKSVTIIINSCLQQRVEKTKNGGRHPKETVQKQHRMGDNNKGIAFKWIML